MKYFTSDLHLMHKNIIDLDGRPFATMDEMIAQLVDNWNATVKPEDIVYLLGDLAFAKPAKVADLVNKLHGRIRLIRGNHCVENDWTLKKIAESGIKNIEDVGDFAVIKLGETRFTLSHYPYSGVYPSEDARMMEKFPADHGNWLLHGHVHGRQDSAPVRGKMINVGCMLWGYRPISEERITQLVADSATLDKIEKQF